jgi:hypothetical protein
LYVQHKMYVQLLHKSCTQNMKHSTSTHDQNLRVASLCGYKEKERAVSKKSRAPMQPVYKAG